MLPEEGWGGIIAFGVITELNGQAGQRLVPDDCMVGVSEEAAGVDVFIVR